MPTYEYRCKACGHDLEVVQSFTDDALTDVPRAAAGDLRKVFGNIGDHLQGQRLLQDRQPLGVQVDDVVELDVVVGVERRRSRSPTTEDVGLKTDVEDREEVRLVEQPPPSAMTCRVTRPTSASSAARASTRSSTTSSEVDVDTPYGAPSAPVHDRRRRRPRGRLPPPPRSQPRAAAAHGPLPGQPLGDARARASPASSARAPSARCSPTSPRATSWCCDQLVDRTWGRRRHVLRRARRSCTCRFADPYCHELRGVARRRGRRARHRPCTSAAPSSSSRVRGSPPGPSRRGTASQGWEVINMTQHPEAYLARELGICYATLALVTDYDSGLRRLTCRRDAWSRSSPSSTRTSAACARSS